MTKLLAKNKPLPIYLFDSFAVFSYLKKESSRKLVKHYLQLAQKGQCQILLNEINLGEIYYKTAKYSNRDQAEYVYKLITAWPITLISVDRTFILSAARWKAQYKISYADAFCIQTAIQYNCTILTGDPEFAAVKEVTIIKLSS